MDLSNLVEDDVNKAVDALLIMQDMYQQEPENPFYVKPTVSSHNIIIDGWAQFQPLSSAFTAINGTEAETEEHISSSASSASTHHLKTQQAFDYDKHQHNLGAQRAQEWLDRLEAIYEATGDPDLRPNAISYMIACQKWIEVQDHTGESVEKAEELLRKAVKVADANDVSESVKLWSNVLDAWCKRAGKVRGAIDRAERLLSEMEQSMLPQEAVGDSSSESPPPKLVLKPNIITYTSFIGGLARSRTYNCAQKAEDVLERMKVVCGIEPDMVAFTALLNCYAKTTSIKERRRAAKRALDILDFMEGEYARADGYYLKPSVITYGTAIKAIGNSMDHDAGALAEQVLRRMYRLQKSGTITSVKPQASTYNAVISAYASHSRRIFGGPNKQHGRAQQMTGLKNARRAEELLAEMTDRSRAGDAGFAPNVRTWGAVISAWAESGQAHAGDQAQRVLHNMEDLYAKGESTLQPNFVCYTTVMAAMGNSAWPNTTPEGDGRNKRMADKVEAMLLKMEHDYERSMDINRRPNTITYITAIETLCKFDPENAAPRSQKIVDRMIQLHSKGLGHVQPSRIVFNSLINAWSRCTKQDLAPAQRAETIFQWMEKQYRDGGGNIHKPDEMSLCGVLNAHANNAKNGGALRAQQILDKIESMTTEERGFQHTTVCHNIVIKAWGRSKAPDAVERAERVLLRLEKQWETKKDSSLKPDVTTYSSVINCCAYYASAGDNTNAGKVFQKALLTFRKLCASETARPNHITYGTLLKAVANLTPMNEEREDIIRTIFGQCCKESQVDSFVLSQVRNASPNALYRELVLEPSGLDNTAGYTARIEVVLRQLPREWLLRNR